MSRTAISQKRATAALTMLLTGCKPEQLSSFTAAGLASSYNVPVATAEKMLARARQGRLSLDSEFVAPSETSAAAPHEAGGAAIP